MKIALLSDTHSHMDDRVLRHLDGIDEIWHAGDIGNLAVTDRLAQLAPVRAVYGNIDGAEVRRAWPEDAVFTTAGLKVAITHIGGYPGRYSPHGRALIERERPGLFICGHSHILKVMPDRQYGLLHMNPGAAGIYGLHTIRTMLRFSIANGKVEGLEAIEMGKRGAISG